MPPFSERPKSATTAFAVAMSALAATMSVERLAFGGSSTDELVRQAQSHEAAHEDDIAARRYMEALAIDRLNPDAWIGLGNLRMRLGEPAEAERVYTAAMEHLPDLRAAVVGRARARWAQKRFVDAEKDLERYADWTGEVNAYVELARWLASQGRTPAELAVWRRVLDLATRSAQPDLVHDARQMVRALVLVVDGSDPASSPIDPDATRQALALIARRAGG